MDTKNVSQGLRLPGAAAPDPVLNTNGLLISPDNTERPVRKPGEGRKYFSYSQYVKYGMCHSQN